MNIILWVIQGFLSAFFIMPGLGKITGSKEKYVADGHLKSNRSITPIRILGVLELLGCIGIIVPWLTGIVPILTPMTAASFCLIMVAGMFVHSKKQEYKMFPMLITIFMSSAMVAYFRFAALA